MDPVAVAQLGPERATVDSDAMEQRLGRIAEGLIANALAHAFPGGRGGRVAVAFAGEDGAWCLTVEDSGVGRAAASSRRGGLRLVRDLAGEIGSRLKVSGLVGGTRCTVVGPQPRAGAFATALREGKVCRYLELARPLEATDRSGDEADAVAGLAMLSIAGLRAASRRAS